MSVSDTSDHERPAARLSLWRILGLTFPVVILAVAGSFLLGTYWQSSARDELNEQMLNRLLGGLDEDRGANAAGAYADADGDLVADALPDDQSIDPDEIIFSYVAAADSRDQASIWSDVIAALGTELQRPVRYVQYSRTADQLAALRNGELHIAGLNTGTVPTAVAAAGFVPVCTFGNADGNFGYTMRIIVPADSPIKRLPEVRGRKVTFTRPTSNSGFKAALVLLMHEHRLLPERDYQWGFSLGHENSIRGIAAGEYEVATVAGDILDRMVAQQQIDVEQIRTIYESERFPPATLGHVHNLNSELRARIGDTLLTFAWNDTPLTGEFGATGASKFVPVVYKDDWANTRRIDAAVIEARTTVPTAAANQD